MPSEASDTDSDLEELREDMAKFDESVRQFLAKQRSGEESSVAYGSQGTRGGGRSRARGPRRPAKPRGDVTARLSRVNQAFMSGDYEQALNLAFEVIRINAETHQAWTALSSIFRELGDTKKALSAMVYAAHLRPRDVYGWMRCASYALETLDEDEQGNLNTARLCYSAALRADTKSFEARLGKAEICHRQGYLHAAIRDYLHLLKQSPLDLHLIRKLSEVAVDTWQVESAVPDAIEAYGQYFENARSQGTAAHKDVWYDIGIFVELFAATRHYQEAIDLLKSLARWAVGRAGDTFWDEYRDDDREWDDDDQRRSQVPGFRRSSFDRSQYGQALPLDLRAKLAIYRLRSAHGDEALNHLLCLSPEEPHTIDFVRDYPHLAYDIAEGLHALDHALKATKYLEIMRGQNSSLGSSGLLLLGRCFIMLNEQAAAEDCFLAALDSDEDNIEIRIELANLYEKAQEGEEALILTAEALRLREARDRKDHSYGVDDEDQFEPSLGNSNSQAEERANRVLATRGIMPSSKSLLPPRRRARRLGEKRVQEEQIRVVQMTAQFELLQTLRQQIRSGRNDLIQTWMDTSSKLIYEFRSLRKFYTWETYLHSLGTAAPLQQAQATGQPQSNLAAMYRRLAGSLGVHNLHEEARFDTDEQGISFQQWLDVFLEYAIELAIEHRRDDAYNVCQSARDSTAFRSSAHVFLINLTWCVCASLANDEEKLVTISRSLVDDGAMSDSYRMFALSCQIAQSPVSWYTHGATQKFILRQIKALDSTLSGGLASNASLRGMFGSRRIDLPDVCLLVLYGHILMTSTSYNYALAYLLRARSIDPENVMVNLSLGLAYVHCGLKRQATNRSYLLIQGLSFLSKYANFGQREGETSAVAETLYNLGRLFQLLGIGSLANSYYQKALDVSKDQTDCSNIMTLVHFNQVVALQCVGNKVAALGLIKEKLML